MYEHCHDMSIHGKQGKVMQRTFAPLPEWPTSQLSSRLAICERQTHKQPIDSLPDTVTEKRKVRGQL